MMTPPSGPARDDRGDTLIEVLIALSIMGVLVAAVITGFLSAAQNQRLTRSLSRAETLTRTYAAGLQADATTYASCSPAYLPTTTDGYTVKVSDIAYWVKDSSPAAFAASCGAEGANVQRLTVSVTDSTGAEVMRTEVVLRTAP